MPEALLLGLVRVWLIVPPLPAEAPVIEPVTVPRVQVNVLETEAVNVIPVPVALQILSVVEFVTDGTVLTVKVTVLEVADGLQAPLTTH